MSSAWLATFRHTIHDRRSTIICLRKTAATVPDAPPVHSGRPEAPQGSCHPPQDFFVRPSYDRSRQTDAFTFGPYQSSSLPRSRLMSSRHRFFAKLSVAARAPRGPDSHQLGRTGIPTHPCPKDSDPGCRASVPYGSAAGPRRQGSEEPPKALTGMNLLPRLANASRPAELSIFRPFMS